MYKKDENTYYNAIYNINIPNNSCQAYEAKIGMIFANFFIIYIVNILLKKYELPVTDNSSPESSLKAIASELFFTALSSIPMQQLNKMQQKAA